MGGRLLEHVSGGRLPFEPLSCFSAHDRTMAKKIFGVRVEEDLRQQLKQLALIKGFYHNSGQHKGKPDLSGLVLAILEEYVAQHQAVLAEAGPFVETDDPAPKTISTRTRKPAGTTAKTKAARSPRKRKPSGSSPAK